MSFRRRKIPKLIPLISLIILLTLIPLIISLLQNAGKVEAAWVDDNFSYRNAIPITSHTAAENNVYVTATIDTSASGQFQSDCGDLRFTTVGGDILPYYIVSGCVSASTVVHVFFKSMPAGAQTIYYYYGNPSAANGFSSSDFSTVATSYAVGTVAAQEKGGAPIAYWKFDEGTGATTKDSSSNGNTGTITNAVWKTEDQCVSGKCLFFDGTGDYVEAADTTKLRMGTSDWSLSAWIKTSQTGTYQIFDKRNGGPTVRYQMYVASGKLVAELRSTSAPDVSASITGNKTINDGKWHYVTATFTRASNLIIYVDGISDGSASISSMSAVDINGASTLVIGAVAINFSLGFNGFIDEPKIYNYARTAAQIKADFKSRGTIKGSAASLGQSKGNSDALSNGLVGYWKTDEATWSGTASEVIDASGNANHGTAQGTTGGKAYPTGGKFGNGGFFDGVDDYVSVAHNANLISLPQATISLWVKPNTVSPTYQSLLEKGFSTGYEVLLNGSTISTNAYVGSTYYPHFIDAGTVTNNAWNHITLTYDGSTAKLFLNGTQVGTLPGLSGSLATTTASMYLGARAGTSLPFNGVIDETRIYNRALSPREVRDLYAFAPGPVGYWSFEEKSGTNAFDTSGNGQTGTINGNPTWVPSKSTGSALNFDGTGDYVSYTLPSTSPLKISGALTLGYWMNTTVGTSDAGLVGTGIATGYQCTHHNGATLYCYISSGGNGITASLGTGIWKYISFTWDGTTGTNGMKLYIDGVLTSQRTSTVAVASGWTTLQIGNSSTAYNGKLDDVKIYNYVRTQKQIVEDMNAGHPVGGSPVGSQVGYWKFDEGYGSTFGNSGSGGSTYIGTINGAIWSNQGKFGKALGFDGTNDYATIPGFTIGPEYTVSSWIYPHTYTDAVSGNYSEWIQQGSGVLQDLQFNNSSGRFLVGMYIGGSYYSYSSGTLTVPLNQWSYVAVTLSGQNLTMYVNGQKYSQTIAAGTVAATANTIYLGDYQTGTYHLNGLLDEVKIYNSALTEDEIKLDYNRGQAMVLGTLSDTSGLTGGSVASSSASAEYCIPGDTATCTSPVARWDFEEGSGISVNDSSGNALTGTITGATWTQGKMGKALKYTNSGDKVVVTHNTTIDFSSNSFTVSAWVKDIVSLSADYAGIVAKETNWGPYTGWWLGVHANGTLAFQIDDATNQNATTISSAGLNDGNWHFLTAVVDRTASTITVYKDSVKSTPASITAVDIDAGDNLEFGEFTGSSGRRVTGKIDGVKIYNYARTPAQVAWDYNRGAPVGHWRMDECQGATAKDSSGFGNNGTITIGATGTQTAIGTCTTSGTAWYNGVTGKFNNSLNFDGTDDYVDLGTNSIYQSNLASSQYTWSAWTKTTADNVTILTYGTTYNPRIEIYQNKIYWYFVSGEVSSDAGNLSDGNWHHVVITNNNLNIQFYIDGKSKGSGTSVSGTTGNQLNIGKKACGGCSDSYFNGQIDDVKIFNYALTGTQVKTLFNGGAAVKFGPVTGSP